MTTPVIIPDRLVADSLRELQRVGHQGAEGMLLWLGRRRVDDCIEINEVYVPAYESGPDYFRIPPASMQAIMAKLRTQRLMIAAQVHTHPFEAFHSPADNHWAIVRHVGALSLVLPDFGLNTTIRSFVTDTVVFCLASGDRWLEVAAERVTDHYRITQ